MSVPIFLISIANFIPLLSNHSHCVFELHWWLVKHFLDKHLLINTWLIFCNCIISISSTNAVSNSSWKWDWDQYQEGNISLRAKRREHNNLSTHIYHVPLYVSIISVRQPIYYTTFITAPATQHCVAIIFTASAAV